VSMGAISRPKQIYTSPPQIMLVKI